MHETYLLENEKNYFESFHRKVRKLIVLQNKLNIKYETDLTDDDSVKKIKECYVKRSKVTNMVEMLRLEYRTQLEEADKMNAVDFLGT